MLFRIGSFEVTSFGVLVAIGALVGLWLFQRELARSRLPSGAADGAILAVMAGLAGAKLLWAYEHRGEEPLFDLLTSRGGLSWFGGLAGGLAAGIAYFAWKRYPFIPVLSAATPGLAAGHALGRVGCFLVGDDYGRPTSLPWGVAFPEGLPPTTVPVHPTQIYEAICLAVLTWALIKWRRNPALPDAAVLGRYLLIAGLVRFAIEFVRINERVFLGLTVAHIAAIFMALAGVMFIATSRSHVPHGPIARARKSA